MNKSSGYSIYGVCAGGGGVSMGGQLRRIQSIPGYLVFRTLCLSGPGGMYGGTTQEDPEYPGILSIPDTVCVRGGMYGGTTWEEPLYNQCRSNQGK